MRSESEKKAKIQLIFNRIAKEENKFSLDDMIHGVCDKLIYNIYGDPENSGQVVKVNDEEDVKRNWEKIKLQEGKESVLAGVPVALPAVVKAARLQEKAKQVGFEWDKREDVWDKVKEEAKELEEAVRSNNANGMEEEFGDLMFSMINYARFLNVDAESALEKTNKKFIKRFQQMEAEATGSGKDLMNMSLEDMDAIWNRIKRKGRRV